MHHHHCIAIDRVPCKVLDFLQSIIVRVCILTFAFAQFLASFAHHLLVEFEEFGGELLEASCTSASHTEKAIVLGGLLYFVEAVALDEVLTVLFVRA